MSKIFEVWLEGYRASGDSSPAQHCGDYPAETFKEACQSWVDEKPDRFSYYDKERNTFWGCRFFDNSSEAKKSFG